MGMAFAGKAGSDYFSERSELRQFPKASMSYLKMS
jgi:hypothetical protein